MLMAIPPRCLEVKRDPRIPLTDPGTRTSVMILNPARAAIDVIKVDDCVVSEGLRADWLVREPGVGSAVIELKGEDAGHGMAQVEATLGFCFGAGILTGSVGALVMCRCVGIPQTKRQIVSDRLKSRYRAKLKFSSSVSEFQIRDLV